MQRPACCCERRRAANVARRPRSSRCSRTGDRPAGRRLARACLRKPFGSATARLHDRLVDVVVAEALGLGASPGVEHPLVVARHDLARSARTASCPVGEQPRRPPPSRSRSRCARDDVAQPARSSASSSGSRSTISVLTLRTAVRGRSTYATPPDMPAAKLRPVGAEHDDPAAGHVLAAVVADALDDGGRAGVADAEALARPRRAGTPRRRWRRSSDDVAGDDVLLGDERRVARSGARRSGRRTGPCRRSRWRRPRAAA